MIAESAIFYCGISHSLSFFNRTSSSQGRTRRTTTRKKRRIDDSDEEILEYVLMRNHPAEF